jgi:hypothetical protein
VYSGAKRVATSEDPVIDLQLQWKDSNRKGQFFPVYRERRKIEHVWSDFCNEDGCDAADLTNLALPGTDNSLPFLGPNSNASLYTNIAFAVKQGWDTPFNKVMKTAVVKLVYSAFHQRDRFDLAQQDPFVATGGSGMHLRVLRINETFSDNQRSDSKSTQRSNKCGEPDSCKKRTATQCDDMDSELSEQVKDVCPTLCGTHPACNIDDGGTDWVDAPGSVSANPNIPTAIHFELRNVKDKPPCGTNVEVRKVLNLFTRKVRWEIVLDSGGLPFAIDGQPCQTELTAVDSVTNEELPVLRINASVQDCFDGTNATDEKSRSCGSHGTCNEDLNPYDGHFEGCDCDDGFQGVRCSLQTSACQPGKEAYNYKEKSCKAFVVVPLENNARYKKQLAPTSTDYVAPALEPTAGTVPVLSPLTIEIGQACRIARLDLDENATNVSSGTFDDITYALDAPAGWFISSEFGEAFGTFDAVGTQNITFLGIDASGLSQPIETITFTIIAVPDKSTAEKAKEIALGAACAIIVLVLIGFIAFKWHARWLSMQPVDFETQFAELYAAGLISEEVAKVHQVPREIRRKDLTLLKVIGTGAFGEVHKAVLDENFTRDAHEYSVAAKVVLNASEAPEARQEILSEASVMAAVGKHPNVVSLIGVITRGDPLMLILSFCPEGSALSMLKEHAAEGNPVSLKDKMQMAREVALGMKHIVEQHFIHRDLAARNVLVGEGMCKIADFGLSRAGGGHEKEDVNSAHHENYYKSIAGVFPVRWTAPEAMETLRFSPASDVWSFGIVVIEFILDGETPYHGMSNPDVMKLTMSGGRHEKPPLCSSQVYGVLKKCWDADPIKRPTFTVLATFFKDIKKKARGSAADANTATVEAEAIRRKQSGEAANEYTTFDADFGEAPEVGFGEAPEAADFYEIPVDASGTGN